MNSLAERAEKTLDPDTDADIIAKFKSIFQGNVMDVMLETIDGNRSEPNAVVCHGDCWNNNLLFKYDVSVQRFVWRFQTKKKKSNHWGFVQSTGKPVEIRFLDWQIARYASPACDITHYLFCCTTKALRDQHYDSLIRIYHNSFTEFLNR